MNLSSSSSVLSVLGLIRTFNSCPPVKSSVLSVPTDWNIAVKPFFIVPVDGDIPSAVGIPFFLPSAEAPTIAPEGILAVMVTVELV